MFNKNMRLDNQTPEEKSIAEILLTAIKKKEVLRNGKDITQKDDEPSSRPSNLTLDNTPSGAKAASNIKIGKNDKGVNGSEDRIEILSREIDEEAAYNIEDVYKDASPKGKKIIEMKRNSGTYPSAPAQPRTIDQSQDKMLRQREELKHKEEEKNATSVEAEKANVRMEEHIINGHDITAPPVDGLKLSKEKSDPNDPDDGPSAPAIAKSKDGPEMEH